MDKPPPGLGRTRLRQVAMHLQATGDDAEEQIRQMCSGLVPRVGQRFAWVCTADHSGAHGMSLDFQLVPIEEPPS